MRAQDRAQAYLQIPDTLSCWHRIHGHPGLRFVDRRGGKLRPHAKPGQQQSVKSGKRKNDTLNKQKKLLSALSRESMDSSEQDDSGESASEPDPSDDVTIVKRASKAVKTKKMPIPLEGSIYDHPVVYDWAFGFRDYEAEARFSFLFEPVLGCCGRPFSGCSRCSSRETDYATC
jgi:hypothetical protein